MPESDNYEVLEKIGHGSFGVIRRVKRKADGMIVCRKEISYVKMSQKEREQLHAEFQILSTLRHENIVGYYHREHLKSSQDLYLYMEYCGGGDLGRVIRELTTKNQYAEETFVWSIFSQLVTALYRCHYGMDPPEVGKNVLGLGSVAKPVVPPGTMTILHRDLKPENVFLGEDNLVKLGDFGLAKMILSHDFASTYVGTPYYMSPEICAAEKYTLKSDVWSLGCIIYELCARVPPFDAKSHFQLVQKIKEGKVAPLPPVYSPELMAVIKDCLRVNPDKRPDTAALLNLPVVRLMRKEKEVVDLGKMLRKKEEGLNRKVGATMEAMRKEMDSALRREWEVKARLEIDRMVKFEIERLQKEFDSEVKARVDAELSRRAKEGAGTPITENGFSTSQLSSRSGNEGPRSSTGDASADGEYSSATDHTECTSSSPDSSFNGASKGKELKKTARTPFARAQTMFAGPPGTPMDIEMGEPSPIAIASLSLSPRRTAATKAPSNNPGNIFAVPSAGSEEQRWTIPKPPSLSSSGGSAENSDEDGFMPSPTRVPQRSLKNPLYRDRAPAGGNNSQRPGLFPQRSAPANKLKQQQPTLPAPTTTATTGNLHTVGSAGALRERSSSPNRRLSRIPSAANLNGDVKKEAPVLGLVSKVGLVRGKTLVELTTQARAGGRPLSAVVTANENGNLQLSPTRRPLVIATGRPASSLEPAAIWDPERDEMPSPFLSRRRTVPRGARGSQ